MIIKIFFKDGAVKITPFDYFYATQDKLILEYKDRSATHNKSLIKNYTVYTNNGTQIHTTYSKYKYEERKNGFNTF